VERSIEILAAIDPGRSTRASPPKGTGKLPVASDIHTPRTLSSATALRERNPPKTPPPQIPQGRRLANTQPDNDRPGGTDPIPSRKSPRGSDSSVPLTRHSAEVIPDDVGGIRPQQPQQVPRDSGSSNVNTAEGRLPWHQWQQSNPERKLPRVILKVREPGT
jgi:hypothetical protein